MAYLLLLSISLPLLSVLTMSGTRSLARIQALLVVLLTTAISGFLLFHYPPGSETFAQSNLAWFTSAKAPLDIQFSLALNGLNIWLYGLTSILMLVSVLVSWNVIENQASLFYRLLMLLYTGMLGVFVAQDIILFYIFFEFTLIPLFFLIGIWGSEQRRYAAIKFFLFTLTGSVLTFLGLLTLVLWNFYHPIPGDIPWQMTFDIPTLIAHFQTRPLDPTIQKWVFFALFAGFAIKVPLVPFHTWLPLAHVQAPTAGSVLLAGILLKIGTYGFLLFCIPMLPFASAAFMPLLLWLATIGIIYGELVALAQQDIKRLIAYSSVSHLGFCVLGIFSATSIGLEGGALQMINHGLSTGGLFAVVGMLYERYHTRQIADYSGLARKLPILAFFMLIFTLSSIGLPGTNGFVGEFLILLGMFQRGWHEICLSPAFTLQFRIIAVLSTSGVVLGAWYMLWLVQRVFFGPLQEPKLDHHAKPVHDLNLREIAALTPLLILIFWIGLYPHFFLNRMSPTLKHYSDQMIQAASTPGITADLPQITNK